jgi:hypothetical protein
VLTPKSIDLLHFRAVDWAEWLSSQAERQYNTSKEQRVFRDGKAASKCTLTCSRLRK